jgi:hypothetical protein
MLHSVVHNSFTNYELLSTQYLRLVPELSIEQILEPVLVKAVFSALV